MARLTNDVLRLGTAVYPAPVWPPPGRVKTPDGKQWRLVRYSQLSDEEAEGMDHVARGAEYEEYEESPGPSVA